MQGEVRFPNYALRELFLCRGVIKSAGDYVKLLEKFMQTVDFPPYPPAVEVLPLIAQRAKLLVLAHPQRLFMDIGEKEFLRFIRKYELDGVEAGHPGNGRDGAVLYARFCENHGLTPTAGTDCHFPHEYAVKLGEHYGKPEWIDAVMARLADAGTP